MTDPLKRLHRKLKKGLKAPAPAAAPEPFFPEIRELSNKERQQMICKSKRSFDLKVKADTKALSLMNHPSAKHRVHVRLRSYRCPNCQKWHLTSKA